MKTIEEEFPPARDLTSCDLRWLYTDLRARAVEMEREIHQCTTEALADLGFRLEASSGRWWHWRGHPGIEFVDGKWLACEWMDNATLQYSEEGKASPVDAAKHALEYFT